MKTWSIFISALIAICWGMPSVSAQQQTLEGSLRDEQGKPVAYANVSIIHGQQVLAFKSSDEDGLFRLSWRDTIAPEALTLTVVRLGYGKITMPLSPGKKEYAITMAESAINLAEVEVKSKPRIDLKGDTLAYNVASFSKAGDRNIGDVLERMPGMEVDEGGNIKYNGKAISNLYIDGDDLFDDGYALGTKAIPHGMVQDVEVLQRHQSKKVLEGKALSDEVALNLKIKDEAKLALAGQATLGGGLPEAFDGSLEVMLFNKRFKMLNTLGANNAAHDLRTDFDTDSYQSGMVSPGTVGAPPLPTGRYYFNRSGALHANNLINLGSGLQLKANAGLLADRNNLTYLSTNALFLDGDTIRYAETQQTNEQPFIVSASLQAQANQSRYFFRNLLSFGYSGTGVDASLTDNTTPMQQQLNRHVRSFSNTLEYVPALDDRNTIDINWQLGYTNKPEVLRVAPGVHPLVLHGGTPYEATLQHIHAPTWNHALSVGYRKSLGDISQHYSIGVNNEWKQLQSELRLLLPGGQTDLPTGTGIFDNNLHWQRHSLQAQADYELKKKRWDALLALPLAWQRITYRDPGVSLDQSRPYLFFNPYLRATFKTSAEDRLSLSYAYNTQLGDIGEVYRGAMLTNYRSLEANQSALQQQRLHNVRLGYQFQRNISMLFANASIDYTKAQSNTIASRIVDRDITRTVLMPFDNDISSLTTSAGISKYLFGLDATSGLKGSWNSTRYNQFLNGQLLPYRNLSVSVTPSVEVRFGGGVSVNYEATGTWTTSRLVVGETGTRIPDRQLRRYDQSLGISYSPFNNTFINISGKHQFIQQDEVNDIRYLFVDANLRYKIKKWRTDIELDVTNIANIRSYETYSLSANQLGYNRYTLRGRLMLLKVRFNL